MNRTKDFKPGQTVTLSSPQMFCEGAMVEICGGMLRTRKTARVVMVHPGNSMTLRIVSHWERFWYVLTHPRHWKRALDIPFTPPDILVRS